MSSIEQCRVMQYVAMLDWKLLLLSKFLVSQASCVELETEKNITLEVLYHISIHQLVRASRIDFSDRDEIGKKGIPYPEENGSSYICHGGSNSRALKNTKETL